MNNLHHIATTIANQYDRHPSDLKRKRYSKLTNIHNMKKAFVNECWTNFEPKQIADFLDHNLATVYRLYEGEFDRKWKDLLRELTDNEIVEIVPESKRYNLMNELRKKGYCIINVGKYTYQLLDTPSKT